MSNAHETVVRSPPRPPHERALERVENCLHARVIGHKGRFRINKPAP